MKGCGFVADFDDKNLDSKKLDDAALEAAFIAALNEALAAAPEVVRSVKIPTVAQVAKAKVAQPKVAAPKVGKPKVVETKVMENVKPKVVQNVKLDVKSDVKHKAKPKSKRKYKLPDHDHNGHRQRLKARYHTEGSLRSFQDHEVLELILFYALPYQNTNGIAHELLNCFGSLSQVLEADYNELQRVDGVGAHVATLLTMVPQIAGRYVTDRWRDEKIFSSTAEICRYAIGLFVGRKNEAFYLICLNSKNQIIRNVLVAEGSIGKVNISVSKVVEEAVKSGSRSVVLAHNHPGGMCKPSGADLAVTRECVKALRYSHIPILDHVIVCGDSTVSFKEKGYMAAVMQAIGREDAVIQKI